MKPARSVPLLAVLSGRAVPYTRPGTSSAIAKRPFSGPVRVTVEGLVGDEQGDRRVHGGPDKAVHHYPFDHYTWWRGELDDAVLLNSPGAFGENLSTIGWTEDDICLADVVRIGTALLEVSQGRQPCWKLNDRFGDPRVARRMQHSGRTGWYYRVLEEGDIVAGDTMELVERRHPDWSIRRLSDLLFNRTLDRDWLQDAAQLPLPPSWRKLIEHRLAHAAVESWERRLHGPERIDD
ncbi:MOSC domain-containing protein [Lysobacter panacisoli]|uniref:MOSC domain-containing protein n=1 Tax=Lysobacter panacisoli TaxID=1255263 RepID=A0ABP9LD81_9GAMM|nr:MOSC domain-containing protein [Lysobacter panacisoli]